MNEPIRLTTGGRAGGGAGSNGYNSRSIANGMVYINSGASMPGNALLAFGVE